ncbi:MAG: tRNA 2-thiouridine(34) synthase MnmA [Acidobacteriota bacterium]
MRRKILVAMSGGVDSSVAALLLLEAGWDVVGVTLRLYDSCASASRKSCCGLEDACDAREVARTLGIEHRILEHQEAFERLVVEPFVREYARGRTPNPCIRCNERVKFGTLWAYARESGCEALATGHHARIVPVGGRPRLLRGRDAGKDQSYVLFTLTEEQRAGLAFPVGELLKEEVRARARRAGLPTAEKAESQDICFVADGDCAAFVERRLDARDRRPGLIRHVDGNVLRPHDGIHRFTVGQRRGLGIPDAHPLYVVALDAETGEVTVGPRGSVGARRFLATDWTWHVPPGERPGTAQVQVRYHHEPLDARLLEGAEGVVVEFAHSTHPVTPGQAAVAYLDEAVVGGGWIAGRLP